MYYSGRWKEITLERMKRQAYELFPLSIKSRKALEGWMLDNGEGKKQIMIGEGWSYKIFPVRFSKEIFLSKPSKGEIRLLDIWTGGESLVRIDSVQ